MSVAVLCSELLLRSQISASATRTGVEVQAYSSLQALVDAASASAPDRVIVDLSHPGLNVAEAIARLKQVLSSESNVLAFGPHVHKERLAAAVAAGADKVISRGEFHARIDAILAGQAD